MGKDDQPALSDGGLKQLVFPARWPATLALLGTGLILYLAPRLFLGIHWRTLGPGRWSIVALIMAISLLPAVRRGIFRLMDKLRWPTPGGRTAMAIVLAVIATLYFITTAFDQGRDLFPKTHDDQSYLLQMRMLAQGRLWMPEHKLADFFDTFYVLSHPKYASLYFPGTALLYVPTIWLSLPTWLMPVCVAGWIVGLLYRIVAEVLDGAAAVLASAVLASLSWFRVYSVLLTSHEPMLLLGMLLIWSWLRWRRHHSRGWLIMAGIFLGWGMITRPADALCFAIPLALASGWRPRQSRLPKRAGGEGAKKWTTVPPRRRGLSVRVRQMMAAGILVFAGTPLSWAFSSFSITA